jgi:hypothetical protein
MMNGDELNTLIDLPRKGIAKPVLVEAENSHPANKTTKLY